MCTRVLYETGYGTYMVGRNADWNDKDVDIVMWLFPRGMKRDGTAGKKPVAWTSNTVPCLSACTGASVATA